MTNKKAIKEYVQGELLSAMGVAFARLGDEPWDSETMEQYRIVMSKEMERVEKMFGFESNSFMRGV